MKHGISPTTPRNLKRGRLIYISKAVNYEPIYVQDAVTKAVSFGGKIRVMLETRGRPYSNPMRAFKRAVKKSQEALADMRKVVRRNARA